MITYPRSPTMCVSQINVWRRRPGPSSNRQYWKTGCLKKNLFIPAKFQFPFLNTRKVDKDNFLTFYTETVYTLAPIILVARDSYPEIPHRHYCYYMNTVFAATSSCQLAAPVLVSKMTAGMILPQQTSLCAPSISARLPFRLPATC